MEDKTKNQNTITILENRDCKITLSTINNFINWRSKAGISTLDDLLLTLLFSYLRMSDESLSNVELIQFEKLLRFVRDQQLLEDELDLK